MDQLTFTECIYKKSLINSSVEKYENLMVAFKKSNIGTPGNTKRLPRYKTLKNSFLYWFTELQKINSYIVKNYKNENRELHQKNRLKKTKI